MRTYVRSLIFLAFLAVLVIVLNVSSDETEALDYHDNMINFDPDEVIVLLDGVEIEPLTVIQTTNIIAVEERTGYYNSKLNGGDYNHNGVMVTALLRDSGIVITAEKKHYSLSFNTENTQGTTPNPLNDITIDETISLPSPSFFRIGYNMVGWNTSNNSSGAHYSIGSYTIDSDFLEEVFDDSTSSILYPEWELINYSFEFHSNGGNGNVPDSITAATVVSGATIPNVNITRVGYSSVVWNTSSSGDGTDISSGSLELTDSLIGTCFESSTTVVLYPKWIATEYRILFNTENTQGTAPNSLNGITIGDAIMLPSPTFSRTGYSMTGWNTGNNSSGVSLSIGNTTVDALFMPAAGSSSSRSVGSVARARAISRRRCLP